MATKKKAAFKRPVSKKAPAKPMAKVAVKAMMPVKSAKAAMPAPMQNCCVGSFCGISCCCPVFGVVATRTFWIASVLAIVAAFGFDCLWHGTLLMPDYLATASMWRPMDQMQQFMAWGIAYHVGLGMALTALVLLMGRTGWWGGFITGVLAMAPVALSDIGAYIHVPFATPYIPEMWALGALIQGGIVGLVVTLVARIKSCSGALCK